jgi:hypothetical protein
VVKPPYYYIIKAGPLPSPPDGRFAKETIGPGWEEIEKEGRPIIEGQPEVLCVQEVKGGG